MVRQFGRGTRFTPSVTDRQEGLRVTDQAEIAGGRISEAAAGRDPLEALTELGAEAGAQGIAPRELQQLAEPLMLPVSPFVDEAALGEQIAALVSGRRFQGGVPS